MTAPRPGSYDNRIYTGDARPFPRPPAPRPIPAAAVRVRPAVVYRTVAEVAVELRVSKMTVYRLVHSGELASIRVSRSFRIPVAAVDEYVKHAAARAPIEPDATEVGR